MNRLTIERSTSHNVQADNPAPPAREHLSPAPPTIEEQSAWRLESWLLKRMLRSAGDPSVSVTLFDGQEFPSPREPLAEIHVCDRLTFWKLVADPVFQFGEAYSNGGLEIKGDLPAVMLELLSSTSSGPRPGALRRAINGWLHRPRATTRSASRKNIYHHYDIGNEFYRLWLDEQLVYTCAYYAEPSYTLEQAQIAKLDHVCRKLQLAPGQRVIEAGCGWGALALHMAAHYGVTVRAFNISHEQIEYARQRAKRDGLENRVEFIEDDWRHIDGSCDRFVSVGMLEHVGVQNYRRLGGVIQRVLAPHGRGLIHTIGRNQSQPMDRWIERRIFPGSRPPTIGEMMRILEPYEFSVLDVENLRLHYAQTLRHWLERFETNIDRVAEMFDERFARIWRLYLASSIAAFENSNMQLFQVLFAPGKNNDVPQTREHLYPRAPGPKRSVAPP